MTKQILFLLIFGLAVINVCKADDFHDRISILEKMSLFNPSLQEDIQDLKNRHQILQFAQHLKEDNQNQDQKKASVAQWLEQQARYSHYFDVSDIVTIIKDDKSQEEKVTLLSGIMQQNNASDDDIENEWIRKEIACATIGILAITGATAIAYIAS